MELQTKALYNLLRLNYAEDPSLPCESWQIEDLRSVCLEALFERLKEAGFSLDPVSFHGFAEECDSPESLAELLLVDLDEPESYDRIYLILFELWRRLLPEKQSLSLFCDELDHQIWLFDAGQLESDEPIQDALANLIEILEEHTDRGAKPIETFSMVSSYCAQDLFPFLVDYISLILDGGNELYSTELLDHFSPYVHDDGWFSFFRIRLKASTNPVEANQQLALLLEKKKAIPLDLLMEALRFIVVYGEKTLFLAAIRQALSSLETQEEFEELLTYAADYFRRRDREDLEHAVSGLLDRTSFEQFLQTSLGKVS